MNVVNGLLVVLIILIIVYTGQMIQETLVAQPEKVCLEERCYTVSGRFGKSKQRAAVILNSLHNDALTLVRYMRDKYLWGFPANSTDPGIRIRKIFANNLTTRYNADVLVEHVPVGNKDTSYTIDKGKKLAVCLREKETGAYDFENYPELLFVTLHELSHIATDVAHHHDNFWVVFKVILCEAQNAGIYTPIDYSKYPIVYCGLNVRYNPYFDQSIDESQLFPVIDQI